MPQLLLLIHNIITHHAWFSVFDVVCQSTINACQTDTESDQWGIQGWSSDTALILLVALEGDSINMFFWNKLHVAIDPPPRGVELEHSVAVTGTRNCLAVFMYIPKNYRTEWERCSSLIINMCMSHHWVFVFLPNLPDRNKELYMCCLDQKCSCHWRQMIWRKRVRCIYEILHQFFS